MRRNRRARPDGGRGAWRRTWLTITKLAVEAALAPATVSRLLARPNSICKIPESIEISFVFVLAFFGAASASVCRWLGKNPAFSGGKRDSDIARDTNHEGFEAVDCLLQGPRGGLRVAMESITVTGPPRGVAFA